MIDDEFEWTKWTTSMPVFTRADLFVKQYFSNVWVDDVRLSREHKGEIAFSNIFSGSAQEAFNRIWL